MSRYKWLYVVLALLVIIPLGMSLKPASANAATQAQINTSVQNGAAWLVTQQNPDGSFGSSLQPATTAFAVAVLEHYAESLFKEPLDPSYIYSSQVQKGLDYLFGQTLSTANGVHWSVSQTNYYTGVVLMAICRSHAPSRVVTAAGVVNGWTYLQVAQSAVDYLAWGQISSGSSIGAWDYSPGSLNGDQSVSGWVTLGLGYARDSFNITLPPILLSRLDSWINTIQIHTPGPDFGGADYRIGNGWVNCYKTGHLLYMMELVGDSATAQRVQDALTYLNLHWNDANTDPGWQGSGGTTPASYIATAAMMKGFISLGIEVVGSHNWFDDFANVIVPRQNPSGSWYWGYWSNEVIDTCWAMLTLLKATSFQSQAVTTNSATGITESSATLNGNLSSLGSNDSVLVSLVWGTKKGGPYPNETPLKKMTKTGKFSAGIGGLSGGVTYYFKAKSEGKDIVYGAEMSFMTLFPQTKKDFLSEAPTIGNPSHIGTKNTWVSQQKVAINQPVTIFANMSNSGDLQGSYTATLKINGQIEDTRTGSVPGNAAVPIQFTVTKSQPGTYTAEINGQVAYFTVIDDGSGSAAVTIVQQDNTPQNQGNPPPNNAPTSSGPNRLPFIVAIFTGVLVIIGLSIALAYKKR